MLYPLLRDLREAHLYYEAFERDKKSPCAIDPGTLVSPRRANIKPRRHPLSMALLLGCYFSVEKWNKPYSKQCPVAAVSNMSAPITASTIPPAAPPPASRMRKARIRDTAPKTSRTIRSTVPSFRRITHLLLMERVARGLGSGQA